MLESDFKDSDGYKLKFETSCSEGDKTFFVSEYKKVDSVSEKKLHCTTCDMHIGTAPASKKTFHTHQLLEVTQCNKCFKFYNADEFLKDEDGEEIFCRWCGQGGDVFCCSTCPFVFCRKCIRSNLSNDYVKEVEENDDWSCFVCDKEILKNHRAQHWALSNFMDKQLEKIQKSSARGLLTEDISTCCSRKKRKARAVPAPPPVNNERPSSKQVQQPAMNEKLPTRTSPAPANEPSPSGGGINALVPTLDIKRLVNDNIEISTTNMMPVSVAPQPLVIRKEAAPPAATPSSTAQAIAARPYITFSRPNPVPIASRPLIKRKQVGPPAATPFRPVTAQVIAKAGSSQFTNRQANPMASNASAQGMSRPRIPTPRPRTVQPQQRSMVMSAQNTQSPLPSTPEQETSTSTIFTQQIGNTSVNRAPTSDAATNEKCDADELEIVEQQKTVIEESSDVEEEPASAPKKTRVEVKK